MNQPVLNSDSTKILCEGLNPEQQEAVLAPMDSAIRVMAGAGTGKTELVTRRFAKLALDLSLNRESHNDITSSIWVSTFTEKAAREMKTRIDEYLCKVSDMSLNSKAWIGTFHGLCHRILQQSDESKNPAGFSILSEIELDLIREDLVKMLLEGTTESLDFNLLKSLEIDDYETLFEEILFRLIPRIKAAGLSSERFYNDANEQLKSCTSLIRGLPVSNPFDNTMFADHDDYARNWSKHLDLIQHDRFSFYPTDWEIEIEAQKAIQKQKDPPSAWKILTENLKPWYKTGYFVTFDGRKKKSPFLSAIRDFSSIEQIMLLEKKLIEIVTSVYIEYQRFLNLENLMDYDDLIQKSIWLLEENRALKEKWQNSFSHFMVDEFQDSNGAQLQLIKLLNGLQKQRLTVVGDIRQSVYGFRFAEPENLHLLFKEFPVYKELSLKINYRSETPILAVANRITEMMFKEKRENLVSAFARDNENPVEWLYLDQSCSVEEAKTVEKEWITSTISYLLVSNAYKPHEIAVLTRDHVKASQIEESLALKGIPAIRQRNLGFFQNRFVKQAVSLLELAEDPHNDFALINLLQQKLTDRELFLLSECRKNLAKKHSVRNIPYFQLISELVAESEELYSELVQLIPLFGCIVEFLKELQSRKDICNTAELFSWILKVFPIISPSEKETLEGQKALKQLNLLEKTVYAWSCRRDQTYSITKIVALIKRSQAKDELEIPLEEDEVFEDAVRIMTIHGAKGLQFPVVFMAGVNYYRKNRYEGLLTVDPQYEGKTGFGLFINRFKEEKTLKKLVYDTVWQIPRSQEEELRLFYVGVTRAMQRFYISSWPRSFPFMNPEFFNDLPVKIVNVKNSANEPILESTLQVKK